MVTVDGTDSHTVLASLTPGVTYQVTVISVKGQDESQPGTDFVTTGEPFTFIGNLDKMSPYKNAEIHDC